MTWADFFLKLFVPLILLFLGLYGLTAEEKKGAVHPKLKLGVVDVPILRLPKPWFWIAKLMGVVFIVISLYLFVKQDKTEAVPPLSVNIVGIGFQTGHPKWDQRYVDLRTAGEIGIPVSEGDSLRLFNITIFVPEDSPEYQIQAKVFADGEIIGETKKEYLIAGIHDLGEVKIDLTNANNGQFQNSWLVDDWDEIEVRLVYYYQGEEIASTSQSLALITDGTSWFRPAPYLHFVSLIYSVNDGPQMLLDIRSGIKVSAEKSNGNPPVLKVHDIVYNGSQNYPEEFVVYAYTRRQNDFVELDKTDYHSNPFLYKTHGLELSSPLELEIRDEARYIVIDMVFDDEVDNKYIFYDQIEIPIIRE